MDDLQALQASLRTEEKLGELVGLAEQIYVDKGYAYSGALSPPEWVAGQLKVTGEQARQLLMEAEAWGLLIRRDCDREAWELPVTERARLIGEFDLARRWKQRAPAFYPTSRAHGGEVALVLEAVEAG